MGMSDAEDGERSPLEDLLVSEISEEAKEAIAEAIDGLVGVTRQEHLITLKGGMDALDLQRKVVAYMLARYARDLLQHGHIMGTTNRMGADDLGAALGVHPADIDDAAMGHGDLRWYREGNQVELPHERVRHAAEGLKFSRDKSVDVDEEELERVREEFGATDEEVAEAVQDGEDGGDGGG